MAATTEARVAPIELFFDLVALYLLAHVGFTMRVLHTVTAQRVVVAIVLLAPAPLPTKLTPLAALAILSGVVMLLVSFEMFRFTTVRDAVRHRPVEPA